MPCLPMIMVRDVRASAEWYKSLLGAENDHDGDEFDQILLGGASVLMLHRWSDGEHGLRAPGPQGRVGDGVALWFPVEDVEACVARARSLGAEIAQELWDNPRAGWREAAVRDPDGYTVALFRFR